MGTQYEQWVKQERRWMSDYRKLILKRMVKKILPMTAIGLGVFFLFMGLISGNPVSELVMMALSGLFLGAFMTGIVILLMLPGLRSGRMDKGIQKIVKRYSMDIAEKELLGREMMEAAREAGGHMDFLMSGPGSSDTLASILVSEHFIYMRGGSPLVNIVRRGDCTKICTGEEVKNMSRATGQTRRYYRFTLYTIDFFLRDREARGITDDSLPDAAFGFFSRNLRDDAFALVKRGR